MCTALIAAFAFTLIGAPAMAQADQETQNRQTIQAAFDAWSAGTGGPFDLLADNARWTITGRSEAAGTYGSRAEFIEQVIVFFDATGQATDGIAYDNTYAWFMRLEDGRVVEVSAFYDSLAFDDLWRRVTPD